MRRTSRSRASYVAMLLCCVALLAVGSLWREQVGALLWRVMAPVVAHNPFAGVVGTLRTNASLAHENEQLRAALASTTAVLADRDALYQENLGLKARMGRDGSVRALLAGVIVRPPAVPYDTLIIDAGHLQGVSDKALVYAGGTTVIGEVDAVYDSTSRVVLFSSPGQIYQGMLMESSVHPAIPVTVEGQGGGTLSTQVPVGSDVAAGDSVLLPGVAGGYVAKVVGLDTKKGESFTTLYLRMPVNVQELRFVEIAK